MTNPPKKPVTAAEVLAEGYDPDWRRKIAQEIYDRFGTRFPSKGLVELTEEVLKRERGEQSEA